MLGMTARPHRLVSKLTITLPKKRPQLGGGLRPHLEVDMPERPSTSLIVGSQSADPIKFCFRGPVSASEAAQKMEL
jgi:hypothetical protein